MKTEQQNLSDLIDQKFKEADKIRDDITPLLFAENLTEEEYRKFKAFDKKLSHVNSELKKILKDLKKISLSKVI